MTRYAQSQSPASIAAGHGPGTNEWEARLYQHYYQRLLAVATTRYRWLGLGPWVDPMRVEWLLVTQGLAAFTFVRAKEELPPLDARYRQLEQEKNNYGVPIGQPQFAIDSNRFTVTRAIVTGTYDDTFTAAGYQTYAPTGATGIKFTTLDELANWKGVPIWGDANRSYYDQQTIALFAARLAHASNVVDVNLTATMRGMTAFGTQDEILSIQTAMQTLSGGVGTVTVKPETLDRIKAFDFGVHPDTVERSHVVAMRLWSEALEALGVEPPAAEKKERQVVDEVTGNRSQIAAVRRLTLTPRRQAASLINRRFFGGHPVVEVVDQWE